MTACQVKYKSLYQKVCHQFVLLVTALKEKRMDYNFLTNQPAV